MHWTKQILWLKSCHIFKNYIKVLCTLAYIKVDQKNRLIFAFQFPDQIFLGTASMFLMGLSSWNKSVCDTTTSTTDSVERLVQSVQYDTKTFVNVHDMKEDTQQEVCLLQNVTMSQYWLIYEIISIMVSFWNSLHANKPKDLKVAKKDQMATIGMMVYNVSCQCMKQWVWFPNI